MPFLYALMALWLLFPLSGLWFAWRRLSTAEHPELSWTHPPVTVIAPMKGVAPSSREFLRRLRSLAYGDYRIVAVVESSRDPAVALVEAANAREGGPVIRIEVAGRAETEGQKVHNLIHGISVLDGGTEIVAFIDADTLPAPDWLQRLVRPLLNREIAAVTGHRWIVPEDRHPASAVVASANFCGILLPRFRHVFWGGSLAMRRDTIDRLDVVGYLRGAVVDDVHLTRLFWRSRARIVTPRRLIVISPVSHTWRSAFAFGRRQYMFVRWYLPGVWALSLGGLLLPVAASSLALGLALRGDRIAISILVVALVCGQLRVGLRRRVVESCLGAAGGEAYTRQAASDRWLAPVWALFHVTCAYAALSASRMRWSGVLYRIGGPKDVRVVERI